jgi:hypothetical protein
MTTLIDGAPEIAPFTTNPDLRLVDMPVQAAPRSESERPFRDFWAELADPTMDRGCINVDAAFCQQIPDIPAGERVATIPADCTQDDLRRKPVMLEWIALHDEPPKANLFLNIRSSAD